MEETQEKEDKLISEPELILKNIENITANQTIQLILKVINECNINDPNINELLDRVNYLSKINLDSLNYLNDIRNDKEDPLKCIDNIELSKILLEKKEGDILLYVEDISRYILFKDFKQYKEFIECMFNNKKMTSCYQIVLANEKQKAVLSYSNNSEDVGKDLDKLSFIIQEHFKSGSNISYNNLHKRHQIILTDCIVDHFNKNLEYYNELQDILNSKAPEIEKNLGIFKPQNENGIKFTKYGYDIKKRSNGNCSVLLKDYKDSLIIPQIIIELPESMGNINTINLNIGNTILLVKSTFKERKIETTNWIKNNLPQDEESSEKYYLNYREYMIQNNIKPLHIKDFSPIVRSLNYMNIVINKITVWKQTK